MMENPIIPKIKQNIIEQALTVKRHARNIAIGTGFTQILRYIKRYKAIIIMYHSFIDDDATIYRNVSFDIDAFEAQLSYLKKHYNIIPLKKLIESLKMGGEVPPYSVVLTFDDGYRSNYTLAYPLLKKYGAHATIFVCPEYVEKSKLMWVNELEYIIKGTEKKCVVFRDGRERVSYDLKTCKQKEIAYTELKEIIKKMDHDEIKNKIDELSKEMEVRCDVFKQDNHEMLTWKEIVMMDPEYVDIGSHTTTHAILTENITKDQAVSEIVKSKRIIEDKTGRNVDLFCYPNGQYTENAREIVKENYIAAVSVIPGYVSRESDVYTLPRISASSEDLRDFIWAMVSYE